MLVLGKGSYTGHTVQRIELSGALVSTTRYRFGESSRDWHAHENLHLGFVFDGGGSSESRSRAAVDTRGGLYFYRAGERHRWLPDEGVSKSLNLEVAHGFLEKHGASEDQVARAMECSPGAKLTLVKMLRELELEGGASETAVLTLILELVGAWQRLTRERTPNWVGALEEFLHERWNESLSLATLARATGVHPVTISRSFPKHFGCTLGEYVRRLRVEKSLGLIKHSERSLTEIGSYCGFSDQSHFIRVFRSVTGYRPGEFRRS